MNAPTRPLSSEEPPEEAGPTRDEAAAAAAVLRRLAAADPDHAAALGFAAPAPAPGHNSDALSRSYPEEFEANDAYRLSMPDLQNGPASLIRGARTGIQNVGVSNFRLPLALRTRDGEPVLLETAVTGSVSLEATKKGINMSRIMRSFYGHADEPFSFETISGVLDSYLEDLGSFDARIALRFRYPMLNKSLRSGLSGYQYYEVAFEMVKVDGETMRAIHLDYVYSSTCPCSLELSEHARATRGQMATPHSQRSVARVSAALTGGRRLWIEDLVGLCRAAIPTETQVMVKREDEQAFAEMNGANPIFVEDAVRLLCAELAGESRIGDFRVAASHQESLHSHDAVSILTSGPTFAQGSYDPRFFDTLIHRG